MIFRQGFLHRHTGSTRDPVSVDVEGCRYAADSACRPERPAVGGKWKLRKRHACVGCSKGHCPSGLSVSASGTAKLAGDKALNMAADIASVPASLAQGFLPGLQTGGIITGRVTAGGTVSVPAIRYDLQWSDAEIRRQGDAGISNLNFKAAGNFENGTLTLGETRLSGPNGLNASANGKVVLGGDNGPLINLNADLAAIPASLANGFVPVWGSGTDLGQGFGSARRPRRRLQSFLEGCLACTGTCCGACCLQRHRLRRVERQPVGFRDPPFRRRGTDTHRTRRPWSVRSARRRCEGGRHASIRPPGLATVGSRFCAQGNGTSMWRSVGTLAAPTFNGTASTSGARLIDVRRNLAVEGISASVSFRPGSRLDPVSVGSLSTGGKVSVGGTVGLAGEFPADLTITLNDATYVDGTLFAATAMAPSR